MADNATEKTTIATAVANAESELSETEETKQEETKQEETKEERKEEKPELTEEETQQALQLFKALKNPEHAPSVIKFIAENAGYSKIETKAEAKKAEEAVGDKIEEMLKEHLGEEFSFLGSKLAPGIKKVVSSMLEDGLKEVRERQEASEQEKLEKQASDALSSISKEFFDKAEMPDEVYQDMQKMMDKYAPSPKDTVAEYLRDIFDMAVAKKGLISKKSAQADRVAKNRSDVASRLASGGGAKPTEASPSNKKMSINEAIEAAEESLKKKE